MSSTLTVPTHVGAYGHPELPSQGGFFIADTLTPLLISRLHRQYKETAAQSRPEPGNISVTWLKTSLANLNWFAKTCQSAN